MMNRSRIELFSLLASLAVMVTIGCASPTPPPALVSARDAYDAASADALVTSKAPVGLYEARKTLDRAELAFRDGEMKQATHLATLAEKRVEIARTNAEGEQAREAIARLGQEREQLILQARTSEAGAAQARARELERELEALEARKTDRGMVLTLGDVLFDFGKADLKPGARVNLDRLAEFLRGNPDREVLIEGHTDSVGSESANLVLSQRRAEAVERYLLTAGVGPSRVLSQGLGKEFPLVSNETPEGRQQNRRVEVVIVDPGKSALATARSRRAASLPAVGAGPKAE
jgi:outer membrane protein OmpA-like peptidoglycan-associated protein